jgi:glutamyl-tRNA reductase
VLASHSGLGEAEAGAYLYTRTGPDAVEHLFRVVTSLDSMILGEAQIQGQVKEAYGRAVEVNGGLLRVGPVLSRLFESALRVGGRVRTETRLGSGAASIPSAAIELARGALGDLSGLSAVVLGAGEMSSLTLQCLQAAGVTNVVVASRTEDRANAVAGGGGARAARWDELSALLERVDIVAAATSAPHPVLGRGEVERALPARDGRTLVILDIALPRDVEPAVASLPGVSLYDLDDLSQVVAGTFERRLSEVAIAEHIIEDAVAEYMSWYRARRAVPLIREMRARAEEVRQRELRRARSALRNLDADQLAAVDTLTKQMLAKLLHAPTLRLKEAAEEEEGERMLHTTRFLFGLDGESGA